MADSLDLKGKIAGMEGIASDIAKLQLTTNTFIAVGDVLPVITSYFTLSQTTGELTNNTAFVFTINAADVGETATAVQFLTSTGDVLMILDLDTALTVSLAGEATIAVGDLSTTL